jgi:predicted transcriptional regulator
VSDDNRRRHGPTDREQEALDLQEAGLSNEEIAAEMGITRSAVTSIIARLTVTGAEPWKVDARHGSEKLLAAIAKHHPEMIRA